MKTIGLVGGIGPESTIDYYRAMIAAYRERQADGSYPSIVINSIDLKRLIGSIGNDDLTAAADYLVDAVAALARAGAALGLIGANAPHIVFDEVQRRSPIRLVSIVQATCDAAKARGFTRLGLFGARFTMQGRFYPDVFSKAGMTLATPDPDDQIYIHDRYMTELVRGVLLDDTRNELMRIAGRLQERAGIEALILGGTELSLILRSDKAAGLPLLDTTRIHAHSAVAQAFG
jgi:aspartate racemase